MLGICLGMQVSLDFSEENDTQTLGLLGGRVQRFKLNQPELKIPHIGWNEVKVIQPHPVLAGIMPGDEFYFVHGYFPNPASLDHVLAETDYEGSFASALGKNNFIGNSFTRKKRAGWITSVRKLCALGWRLEGSQISTQAQVDGNAQ